MKMALSPGQHMRLALHMLQAVRVLRMNAWELDEYISEACAENPLLEQRLSGSMNEWYTADNRGGGTAAEDSGRLQLVPASVDSLREDLHLQAAQLPVREKRAVHLLIDCLNDDGYLEAPMEWVIDRLGGNRELAAGALSILQSFEPAGIGARDLQECLLLQLERTGRGASTAAGLVRDCLDLVARNQLESAARKLGGSLREVKEAADEIRSLQPRPGSVYATQTQPSLIIPDILVVHAGEAYRAELRSPDAPVALNTEYLRLLRSSADDGMTRSYLSEKNSQARWLLRCIARRSSTLLAVAEAAVSRQQGFFREGAGALAPLTLRETAEMLGMHESTVSRAVKGKYFLCSRGVLAFSVLFSRGLQGEHGNAVSPEAVKEAIRRLIRGENQAKPLTDRQIAEQLEQAGMHAARRTVAKYREELLVPNASDRKRRWGESQKIRA